MPLSNLTVEQKAIVEAEEPQLAITAYAGTGKTTTLKLFAQKRPRARTLYLAFNKTMAEEAKRAFADCQQVEVRTIHSLAWRRLGYKYQNNLGNFRPLDLMEPLRQAGLEDNYYLARVLGEILRGFMLSAEPTVASLLKNEARSFNKFLALNFKPAAPKDIKNTLSRLGRVAEKVWQSMIDKTFPIPHNGYLKLFQLNPGDLGYDWILVDEAQDLNDCMIDLITRASGRKILVGDPFQQIYEWNGAVNALKKTAAKSAVYYLTRSFRCPTHVAEQANQALKLLSAPKPFTGTDSPKPRGTGPTALIARTTFGIFKFAVENHDKIPLAYNGGLAAYEFDLIKDIYYLKTQQLRLIRSAFIKNFNTLEDLSNYAERAEDMQLAGKLRIVERYKDEVIPLYDLLVKNERAPQNSEVLLSTAHRVKGQEFGSVILAGDFIDLGGLCQAMAQTRQKIHPAGRGRPPRLMIDIPIIQAEEIRLIYVAMTRTRGDLTRPDHYLFSDEFVKTFKSLLRDGWLKLV
ncbi:MAG: UvrD-helicase domain-containing protein [Deltaproteobacteria bacterium]|nr:UvrD-helicase domain-containing protein [Deltaproteobacteria bacterium]